MTCEECGQEATGRPPGVTEVRPGTYVFNDRSQIAQGAATVADPPASFGWVWGHDDWNLVRLSEEHGVMDVPPDADVHIGDRLVIVPNHICPTINLADAVTIVEGGQAAGRRQVAARGRVQ